VRAGAIGVAALLLAALPSLLQAQDSSSVPPPAISASVDRWRASLAAQQDTVPLLALEQERIAAAKAHRDSALIHLELGFIAVRIGELGGRSHFDDAAGEFEWVIELEPRWAYPWYGLALAELGLGDSRVSPIAGIQAMLHKDKLSRSAAALQQALNLEPAFTPALLDLSRIALAQRTNVQLTSAVTAHRLAAGSANADQPQVLLARGRVERLAGSPDSALVAFRRYEAVGGDTALALLEQARTLFVLDSLSGQVPYYTGAALDDTTAVAGYRLDIAPIATVTEMEAFDAASGAARSAMLQHFWTTRDRQDLRASGERLREHYQRLQVARLNYRLVITRRRYDTDERYHSGSTEMDDRGIIYVRHGAPTDSATYVGVGACYNLSWRYARPEGDLVFHFVARDDVADYRLVESLLDIADAGGIRRIGVNDCGNIPPNQLVQTRLGFSPLYDQLLNASNNNYSQLVNQDRVRGIQSIIVGTTTDRFPLNFAAPLELHAAGVAVGTDEGAPLLQVAFAVRGASLHAPNAKPAASYDLRVRLVALTEQGEPMTSIDTVVHYAASTPVEEDGFLVSRVALPVFPGPVRWRLAVDLGGNRGATLPLDSLNAASPEAELSLSGLALGATGSSAVWHNSFNEAVLINPLAAWRTGAELELYAEVYGAAPGAPLAVEVSATRWKAGTSFKGFGNKGRSLTVKSDEVARGPVSPIRKTLSLAGLSPGDYVISVRVSDANGGVVERHRSILVRPASHAPSSAP
jgi:GWxTD domain-containing protein